MDTYEKFLSDLKRNLDVDLSGYKRPQMERRINALMRTLRQPDYDSFINTMKRDRQVFERFIDHLTINVSEFFRNYPQWEIFQQKILPLLLADAPVLRIWSAGCATGEEAYTLAMILSELPGQANHAILATDFDDRVLKKAVEGVYSSKAVAGVPASYLHKYFIRAGENYRVREDIKKMITFRLHNLLRDPFPSQIDLIVCRNVVIYFTEETKRDLYKKLYSALRPGGILFTGNTEQVIQAREIGFDPAATFFYRKKTELKQWRL